MTILSHSKQMMQVNIPAVIQIVICDMEIKVNISSLLVFISSDFWLLMSLEPRAIFPMVSPGLLFQLSCS